MGKLLLQQRKGKGSPSFRRPSHRFKANVVLRPYDDIERSGVLRGTVKGFIDDPGHSAILMRCAFENGNQLILIAPEGIAVGSNVQSGANAELSIGSALPLSKIPDGTPIYNIEANPGDGGKFARGAGTACSVISHEAKVVLVRLPSKAVRSFDPKCRAQVGVVAGGGAKDQPYLKAGRAYHVAAARNLRWPNVRGVAMNPYNHPYGGKENHPGKPTTTARGTPPGRKVGHLAARTTGRGSAAKQALKMEQRAQRKRR